MGAFRRREKGSGRTDIELHQSRLPPAGAAVLACYACGKCTAGCPVAPHMDLRPHQLMRLAQLGLGRQARASRAIWLCVACLACSERCPREADPATVIEELREQARSERVPPAEPGPAAFQDSLLEVLRWNGRLHELTMLIQYKLRTRDLLGDLPMGMRMMLRGKLRLLPRAPAGARQGVRALFRAAGRGPKREPAGEP